MFFTKFAPMTGIFISCASKHRRLTGLGIWCHSGDYRKIGDERHASVPLPMYGKLLTSNLHDGLLQPGPPVVSVETAKLAI